MFTNSPRPVLTTAEGDEQQAAIGVSTLIHMDDPQHRAVRAIGADWFRPKAMRALKVRIDELAKRYVDQMLEAGTECDFVQEVAVNYPLYVIMSMLGVPESDFPRMLKYTQELFGSDDAEFQRGTSKEEQMVVLLEMFGYFNELTASRRENPTEDLASAIANAKIDGEPLSDIDTVSYYLIIATAGHDTTSATIAGGLHALIENPDQRERLRDQHGSDAAGHRGDDPLGHPGQGVHAHGARGHRGPRCSDRRGRIGAAVLCVEPTATKRFSTIRSGSTSDANRTSTTRSDTACTSVSGRRWPGWRSTASSPNCCRGSSRSRLAGDPAHIATIFVGGLKHLPIRYSLR